MNKTLNEKLLSIRAAEAAYQATIADLLNVSTGEALLPGQSVVDLPAEASYSNAGGAIVRSTVVLTVKAEAPTS